MRKEYPLRRECNLLRVVPAASEPELARRLLAAGFDLGG